MYWIAIALISPVLHAFANILDNYLSNKLFKNIWTLTFYSSCFNILFLPLIFFIEVPSIPSLGILPFFALVAVVDFLYLYPYYKALQNTDTSIVSSLFALGKIFVPLFAFFIVGEVLNWVQYLGFIIIIFCSALLTLDKKMKHLRLNKSFFLMALSSALISVEAVIYKYIFGNVTWSTGFFWSTIFSIPITLSLLLIPKLRQDIRLNYSKFIKSLHVMLPEELLTFGGLAASTYAISLIPVTVEKSIDSFQPFFTLIYGVVLSRFFPNFIKEQLSFLDILKKGFLFLIMIIGVILVAY